MSTQSESNFHPEKLYNYLKDHVESKTPIKTKDLLELVKTNAASALIFCTNIVKERIPELEELIAGSEDPGNENLLIGYIVCMTHENGIEVKDGPIYDKISKNAELCIRYAQLVVEGRVPEFEPIIMKSGEENRKRYTDLLQFVKSEKEKNGGK